MRLGEHIVLALAVAAFAANLLVHLDRQVIVADVDEYWLHGTTRYYQLMILFKNSRFFTGDTPS